MNEEKVINFIQEQIMDEWRMVMNYEAQLKKPEWEGDEIISAYVANSKDRIEMFTIILNKFEQ